MLVVIDDLPNGVIGLRALGEVALEDFATVVEPTVDEVVARAAQLRLVFHLGPDFTGFGPGAWGEMTSDIRTMPFHRGAVVTDDDRIRTGVNVLKWLLRGQVRTFRNHEYPQAVSWVAS